MEIMDFSKLKWSSESEEVYDISDLRSCLNSLTEEKSGEYVVACEGGEITFSYSDEEFFGEGDYRFTLYDAKKRIVTIIALKSVIKIFEVKKGGKWKIIAHSKKGWEKVE